MRAARGALPVAGSRLRKPNVEPKANYYADKQPPLGAHTRPGRQVRRPRRADLPQVREQEMGNVLMAAAVRQSESGLARTAVARRGRAGKRGRVLAKLRRVRVLRLRRVGHTGGYGAVLRHEQRAAGSVHGERRQDARALRGRAGAVRQGPPRVRAMPHDGAHRRVRPLGAHKHPRPLRALLRRLPAAGRRRRVAGGSTPAAPRATARA